MKTSTKTFLVVSVIGFVIGNIIDFGGFSVNPSLTTVLPIGAVFFGIFLISLMLEKEMAAFDEEETGRFQLIQRKTAAPVPILKTDAHSIRGQFKEKTLLHEH